LSFGCRSRLPDRSVGLITCINNDVPYIAMRVVFVHVGILNIRDRLFNVLERVKSLSRLSIFISAAVIGAICWSSSSILFLAFLPMVSPLHYSALLSSLDLELDRPRLALAASERLSSIHNWRYVVDSLCSAREA